MHLKETFGSYKVVSSLEQHKLQNVNMSSSENVISLPFVDDKSLINRASEGDTDETNYETNEIKSEENDSMGRVCNGGGDGALLANTSDNVFEISDSEDEEDDVILLCEIKTLENTANESASTLTTIIIDTTDDSVNDQCKKDNDIKLKVEDMDDDVFIDIIEKHQIILNPSNEQAFNSESLNIERSEIKSINDSAKCFSVQNRNDLVANVLSPVFQIDDSDEKESVGQSLKTEVTIENQNIPLSNNPDQVESENVTIAAQQILNAQNVNDW